MERLKKFIKDERGASMPEYALLVALIAVVVIAGASLLGTSINGQLTNVGNKVASPTP
jgi:pilus assembly protein Flp/PilA